MARSNVPGLTVAPRTRNPTAWLGQYRVSICEL